MQIKGAAAEHFQQFFVGQEVCQHGVDCGKGTHPGFLRFRGDTTEHGHNIVFHLDQVGNLAHIFAAVPVGIGGQRQHVDSGFILAQLKHQYHHCNEIQLCRHLPKRVGFGVVIDSGKGFHNVITHTDGLVPVPLLVEPVGFQKEIKPICVHIPQIEKHAVITVSLQCAPNLREGGSVGQFTFDIHDDHGLPGLSQNFNQRNHQRAGFFAGGTTVYQTVFIFGIQDGRAAVTKYGQTTGCQRGILFQSHPGVSAVQLSIAGKAGGLRGKGIGPPIGLITVTVLQH